MTYKNGIVYEGNWKNDQKDGRGVIIYFIILNNMIFLKIIYI